MADVAEKILTQTPRMITDIATGSLSIIRQLAELRLLNENLSVDERNEVEKDLDVIRELAANMDHLTEAQRERLNTLENKYSSIIIPETDYLSYREKLEDKNIDFATLDLKNSPQRLLVFNKQNEKEVEETKEAVFAENFYLCEVSDRQLRSMAIDSGQKMVCMRGIGGYELDLFRMKAKDFNFSVIGDEQINVMAKDLPKAQETMQRVLWELTTHEYGNLSKSALDYDREFHKELYDNMTIPDGRTVYVCSKENDEYLEIGDNDFALYKYGKEIERQKKDAKDFDALAMYTATRGILSPVILTQDEFEKNFEKRKEVMKKKPFRPAKRHLSKEQLGELDREQKREAYFKNLLIEKKLGLDNNEESKLVTGIYDAMVSFSEAEENDRQNEEFKEKLIDEYKLMDLDDKEAFFQEISGLSPEEVEAIGEHMKEYIDELQNLKTEPVYIQPELDAILNEEEPGYNLGDRYDPDDRNYNGISDDYETR